MPSKIFENRPNSFSTLSIITMSPKGYVIHKEVLALPISPFLGD